MRFGKEKHIQEVWRENASEKKKVVGKEEQLFIQAEKEALKQRMESEIVRLKENISIIKEKQERLAIRIAEVHTEVASDDGTDPHITGARVAILKKYEKYRDLGEVLLMKETIKLEEQEARYRTVPE